MGESEVGYGDTAQINACEKQKEMHRRHCIRLTVDRSDRACSSGEPVPYRPRRSANAIRVLTFRHMIVL